VIKAPTLTPSTDPQHQGAFVVTNDHLPQDSTLFQDVLTHQNTDFLFMNLQCNLIGAGTQVPIRYKDPTDGQVKQLPGPGNPDPAEQTPAPILGTGGTTLPFTAETQAFLDCGTQRFPDIVPYILIVAIMVGLTFFQTFQMQRASPAGSQSSQQQTITRVMPLMFAFFGLQFPAGLVVYWTVSNALQIAQQTYLIRAGHIGPEALERRRAEQPSQAANPKPRRGVMAWISDRAQAAQQQRTDLQKERGQKPSAQKPKGQKPSGQRPKGSGSSAQKKGSPQAKKSAGRANPGKGKAPNPGSSGSGKNPIDPTPRRKGVPPGNELKRDPQVEPPEDDDER